MSDPNAFIAEFRLAALAAVKDRNFARAAGYLRMIYQNLNFHFSMYRQITFDGLDEREVQRLLATYVREFPDDPSGYMMQAHMYHNKVQAEQVRRIWNETCANALKGFHFQPSRQASIFDAEQGARFTSLREIGLGQLTVQQLESIGTAPVRAATPPPAADAGAVECLTMGGEPIGADGVSLNGRVSGFTRPTRYYFRYGFDPAALTATTEPRYLPAGQYGCVRDTGENLLRRISVNTCHLSFGAADNPNEEARFPNVAMNIGWPFGKDRNHLDGIGVIDLLLGWKTHAQHRGRIDGMELPDTYPTVDYPGEEIDLRDARVTFRYRSTDLVPKAYVPVIWIHGRTGTAAFPEQDDDRCAWAVTAPERAATFAADGAWHDAVFDMPATSTAWTFCGSNTAEMGGGMRRYTYAPIDAIQRANRGGNVCVTFVGGDDLDTPEGSIDLAELKLRYRSRSVIGPGQDAALISGPDDAGCLTDGTLGDVEHTWQSKSDDGEPPALVWRIREAALLTSFKIHQNVLAPTAAAVIAVSDDGESFVDVWSGGLDDVPENPAAWGGAVESNTMIRTVVLKEPVQATFVRLTILSGHRPGIAGLDGFEVFAGDFPFIPSPSPCSLSESLTGLDRCGSVYAQLVAENDDGVFEGDVVEVPRPDGNAPHILSAVAIDRHDDAARVFVRTIGMGEGTSLELTLRAEGRDDISVGPCRISEWHVPADKRIEISGLEAGVAYECTCVARNAHGPSDEVVFTLDA